MCDKLMKHVVIGKNGNARTPSRRFSCPFLVPCRFLSFIHRETWSVNMVWSLREKSLEKIPCVSRADGFSCWCLLALISAFLDNATTLEWYRHATLVCFDILSCSFTFFCESCVFVKVAPKRNVRPWLHEHDLSNKPCFAYHSVDHHE